MRKIPGLLFLIFVLAGCSVTSTQPETTVESGTVEATAAEIEFCNWWRVSWKFPTETEFELADSVLSERAVERALEVVRRQPVSASSGIDWFELTDRYGRAMLAVAERAPLRSSNGWGGVLDQVTDGYQGLNDACVAIPFE
jgi:hypothetical protein